MYGSRRMLSVVAVSVKKKLTPEDERLTAG